MSKLEKKPENSEVMNESCLTIKKLGLSALSGLCECGLIKFDWQNYLPANINNITTVITLQFRLDLLNPGCIKMHDINFFQHRAPTLNQREE